ncbi:hypothetical protein ACED51_22495 [Photobacterium swingsii]|uniref:hypothetical protein n=1 Tax=Photobacterium swingsii TaxID=680026 RepID=UPI00352FBD2F
MHNKGYGKLELRHKIQENSDIDHILFSLNMSRTRIILVSIFTLLLSACSPAPHQSVDVAISFITQAPDTMLIGGRYQQPETERWLQRHLQQAYDQAQVRNANHIGFYSDQRSDKPLLTPAFSYVTALVLNEENIHSVSHSLKPQQSIIASNVSFGLKQYGAHVYAYNNEKLRSEAFIQSIGNEKVAYLALIKKSAQTDNAPLAEDLALLGHSVDQLYTHSINKVVLLNQYDERYAKAINKAVKGIDVIISAGNANKTIMESDSCMAYFDKSKPLDNNLYVEFDAFGHVDACTF